MSLLLAYLVKKITVLYLSIGMNYSEEDYPRSKMIRFMIRFNKFISVFIYHERSFFYIDDFYEGDGNEIKQEGTDWYGTAVQAFWDKIEAD